MNRSGVRLLGRDPKGQVLVLFALMLVVLLLMSALAVDYGGWLVARRNYQNVADAASLAGAQQLTRAAGAVTCANKNLCARTAAWESVKDALKFTGLNPSSQASSSSSTPYQENGYKVWVSSPPADAGSAWLGQVSGPGDVYVRVDREQASYFSRIASIGRTVTSWATAGQFSSSFALIALCRPAAGNNCLAGDDNVKIDGNNSLLAIETGDLGTNAWTKTAGNGSAIGLGPNSNAYEEEFNTCWNAGNQCELVAYSGGVADYSTERPAVPLGAPITDPGYPAPTISNTTAPNQCRGTGTVTLASIVKLPGDAPGPAQDLDVQLAAAVVPVGPVAPVPAAPKPKLSGLVRSQVGSTLLSGISVSASPDGGPNTTGAAGSYSFTVNGGSPAKTYTVTATDPSGTYHDGTTTVLVGTSDVTAPTIFLQKNPIVTGTVRDSVTNAVLAGVTVTITALGTNYVATTNASGVYTKVIPIAGATVAYSITGTLAGYTSGGSSVAAPTDYDQTYTRDFTLTPAPATLTGTITDQVTTLPVPGVTVTLTSGATATTDASGVYTFASVTPGSTTITLGGTAMVGYAYSTPANPRAITIAAGANTQNFTLWPKGCYDGNSSSSFGSWSCSWPSGSNCPATTSPDASDGSLTCTFTQANAIRPGTYKDITLPNNTCAWLDPRGGVTGLATGQMAGIYHIKGTISLGSNSYLFGDGVTIVMDQGSSFDVNNGGGFVLNYGTRKTSGGATCVHPGDFATARQYNDGFNPCFQTPTYDGQDYAYAAWTTAGTSPWQSNSGSGCAQTTPLAYNTTNTSTRCVTPGTDLGITFWLNGSGLGNASRFKLSTTSMGYLFNGALYGPRDDIQLGGGKNGQTAAGQIIGWTIEYHGGTNILQYWYGDPASGPPFLVEPILGE